METSGPKDEVLMFVRKHSWEVADDLPENEVAQGVAKWGDGRKAQESKKDREWIEWQQWLCFDRPETDDKVALVEQCKSLLATWKDFQQRFPEAAEINTARGELPSIWTLRTTADGVMREWELKKDTRWGRARGFLSNYCDTLVAHSNLFAVIPQGDKYTSLFTGVVSSMIKAIARHGEIAEGFSRALSDINADFKFACRQGAVCPTDQVKELVVLMYIKYFKFLCDSMDWFSSRSRRMKSAFNQTFYSKEVQEKTKDIRDMLNRIKQEASLSSQEKVNATFRRVMELSTAQDLDNMVEAIVMKFSVADQNRQLSEQMTIERLERLSAQIGEREERLWEEAHNSAMASVERMFHERKQNPKDCKIDHDQVISLIPRPLPPSERGVIYNRRQLEADSRLITKYIDGDNGDANGSPQRFVAGKIPGEIVTRLQKWISADTSQALWILGRPFAPVYPEQSVAAAHIVSLAGLNEIPCVSYFCKAFPTSYPDLHPSPLKGRLTSLFYSLIRQLMLQVPESFVETYELQEELNGLDGSPDSVSIALRLIRRIMELSPGLMFVVIDSLHWLDNPNGSNNYISELLKSLRGPYKGKIIKLLVTTRGFRAIGGAFTPSERLDCSRLPRRKVGAGTPGSMSLQRLHLS